MSPEQWCSCWPQQTKIRTHAAGFQPMAQPRCAPRANAFSRTSPRIKPPLGPNGSAGRWKWIACGCMTVPRKPLGKIAHGNVEKSQGIYEHIWECMGIYGNIWEYMGIYEHIWECMGIYGNIWECMGIYMGIYTVGYDNYVINWGLKQSDIDVPLNQLDGYFPGFWGMGIITFHTGYGFSH